MSGNNLEDTLDLVQEVANVWHRLGRCDGSPYYVPETKYVQQEAQEVIEKLKDKVRELCNNKEEMTEAERLLSVWADLLPPNGELYRKHTALAREYFERRARRMDPTVGG